LKNGDAMLKGGCSILLDSKVPRKKALRCEATNIAVFVEKRWGKGNIRRKTPPGVKKTKRGNQGRTNFPKKWLMKR